MLFKVGLVLLKYTFSKTKTLKECPTMYETVDLLRHLPPSVTDENALVARVCLLILSYVYIADNFNWLCMLIPDAEAANQ